jgi:cystathionine beta-lyase/cystathionine gamma-synthase
MPQEIFICQRICFQDHGTSLGGRKSLICIPNKFTLSRINDCWKGIETCCLRMAIHLESCAAEHICYYGNILEYNEKYPAYMSIT